MISRQNFNYHTHTLRCGHAVGDDEEYIQKAIEGGFKILGMSEHLGYEGWDDDNERIRFANIDEYLETMYGLKEKYRDQIDIRVGFEFEYFDDAVPYLREIKGKCDYLINGQHAKDRLGYYYHDQCNDEDVLIYADQVCKAIESGLSQYLAHPDYFMLGRKDFSPACAKAIHQMADCAAKHHIPVEINLKGLRYGKQSYPHGERYVYPHREVWEIIAQYDCDIVYGYDAHNPLVLLEHERQSEADEIIKALKLHFLKELVL